MTTTSLSDRRLPAVHLSARGLLLGFSITLAAGLFLLVAASLLVAVTAGSAIMPRVSVGGVAVGGLSRDAARERLTQQLPSLVSGQLTVTVGEESVAVPYQRIGRGYEIDEMLDAALAVGRDPNPLTAGVQRLRLVLVGADVPAVVHADDPAALEAVVSELAARFSQLATNASVRLESGRFTAIPGADGFRLDLPALRAGLAQVVATPDPADTTLTVSTLPIAPGVTTAQATQAAEAANAMAATPLTLQIGSGADDPTLELSSAQLQSMIGFARDSGGYAARLDEAAARAALVPFAAEISVKPRDARFTFGSSGISGVTPAVAGRELDLDASVKALAAALQARVDGEPTPQAMLAVSVTQPPLTTAAAEAAAPKMKRISTWTTYYVPAISNYWGKNISIPAHDLDGTVLAPGEWFDFWNDIGPVTTARGYGQGGAIIGGKTELTGALAGGICSTSTTIFNAALRAGLEIGERTNHYYYISRYPLGLDATVYQTDTYTLTMTFQNDTPDPIVIRSYTGSGWVRFDLWGVPTGRTVTLTRPIVTNVRHAAELVEVDKGLKPGTRRRIESPHDGMNVSVTRYVRDKDGQVIHTDTFHSAYNPVPGVTLVGPKPVEPPPPSPEPTPIVPPPAT